MRAGGVAGAKYSVRLINIYVLVVLTASNIYIHNKSLLLSITTR